MALVNAKCTNCGGALQVDDNKEAAVCPFCGSAFIVEKAVQNFNIVNNISAGVVHIHGKAESDFVIEGNVLKQYKGNEAEIVIPDTVREIARDAFRDKRYITSVTMPDRIEIIGMGAFCGCERLKKVVLPEELLVVGDAAFANCRSLPEIELPANLEKIGAFAFIGCDALTEISLPDSVWSIGIMAFYGLKNLKRINIPRELEKCCVGAFAECLKLKELHFNGTPDEFIRLFANIDYTYSVGDMDSTVALQTMCAAYPVCPDDFKDEETGALYEGFELDEAPPEFSPLDAIYCKDSLLEGTLRVPDDVALALFASTFTPIKGYKRIACIEYKKGQKETKFCPVCGNYKSISMFGKCKICGTKYAAVK